MAKAKQKHGTVALELPVKNGSKIDFKVYINGDLTPRQSNALFRISEGFNGQLGVIARAGGRIRYIEAIRCILETVADQLDEFDTEAMQSAAV